jgi:c-di-GMP-binding flagellar brake protein YcgR
MSFNLEKILELSLEEKARAEKINEINKAAHILIEIANDLQRYSFECTIKNTPINEIKVPDLKQLLDEVIRQNFGQFRY